MGIFFCADEHEVLRRSESAAKDHVAQLSVEHPLLLRGLKFDIRAFVIVRSYHPFVVYMHRCVAVLCCASVFIPCSNVYARLAPKPMSEATGLDDLDAHLTVTKYVPGAPVLHRQDVMTPAQLAVRCSMSHIHTHHLNRPPERG